MKSGLIWMVLAVATLVSTSAWAVWNPDTDASLIFYMNFESYDNVAHDTNSAIPAPPDHLKGLLNDFNTANPNVFGELSATGLGYDANFAAMHDNGTGAAIVSNLNQNTDCHVDVTSYDAIFNLSSGFANDWRTDQHTWTFWFNVPNVADGGTLIRHASLHVAETGSTNLVWEIRIYNGKLQFNHKNNTLRIETASTLSDLGLTANTWHHAAIAIDRSSVVESSDPTTRQSSKIYVDGLEVPILVNSYDNTESMNVDNDLYVAAPIWFGAGEREFDGLLDDMRLFSRDLTAVEVSILNQPDKTKPVALLPIPRSSNVAISTGLSWSPVTGATTQSVYFGTATDANLLPFLTSGTGSLNSATPSGALVLNTDYYWYIKTNDSNGPVWSFTTETGKAINPFPVDGAEDIDVCDINLLWSTPTTATFTVYASTIRSLVESSDSSVQIYSGTDPCKMGYSPLIRNSTFYWRVNSNYGGSVGLVMGDIWSFRTKPYELVFNTSGVEVTYADQPIPAYTCLAHKDGWSEPCATGTFASDGVVVFNFPNGFNYSKLYDIIVVPEYRATDVCSPTHPAWFPTPLAIHVTGDFYFDGRVQIAGDDITTTSQYITFARSGGFGGPKNNQDSSIFNDRKPTISDYWNIYLYNPSGDPGAASQWHHRFGDSNSRTEHNIYEPTALAKSVFGPGQPVNPPYKGGGGGGAGGVGGESGRGFFHGVFTGGPSYGDKEVPVPFGGSAGGWGGTSSPGGAAGGGGIEIFADGNVIFDVNSQIKAKGGGQLCSPSNYPAGGGGGGSVRIIANGSVTLKGIIDVNGGKGGDGGSAGNLGGGGGGGRVAIFYGTTYSHPGTIAANGGAKGITMYDPCVPGVPVGLALSGQNGTIFTSTIASAKKASAPTPANGEWKLYCNPDPCTIQLKWYSGYGGGTDRVYCDNNPNPTTQIGGDVSATRGQHSVTMTGVNAGKTYYMKVITDTNVISDIWSFKTVNWKCPIAFPGSYPHPAGFEWDSNHDCVIDMEDFDFFIENWLNSDFGQYIIDNADLARFAREWRQNIRQ